MPDQSSAATEHAILQEITQPLEALPDNPLASVDADFPSALRGYDRMAVDEYVARTRRLVAELQATRSPEAAVRRALERVGEQISGILQRAHETAEQITAQSRSEAEDRLQQARAEAAEIAGAAEQRVRDLDSDTDRIWLERQRIVSDAEDLAGQLQALAKTAAERFPSDAETDAAGAPHPYEDEHVASTEAVSEDAFAAYDEDEQYEDAGADLDDDGPVQPDSVADKSEIERTMAFEPLEPRDPELAADPELAGDRESAGGPEPPEPAAATDDEPPATRRFTDDESTNVIPPASQAANRRRSQ
jgi:cell division septum initiation protein DivIVA